MPTGKQENMVNNKYFTPSIEDIRVGYECETYSEFQNRGFEWTKLQLIPNSVKSILIDTSLLERVRVPYLTKEQIEAEGWKQLEDKSPFTGKSFKWQKIIGEKETGVFNEDHIYTLTTELLDRRITIHLEWESSWNRFSGDIYVGSCRCINDFKLIMKLLCIK